MRRKRNMEWLKKAREWIQSRGLEKWLKRDNLIILVLSGILLFIIALPMEGRDSGDGSGAEERSEGAEMERPASYDENDAPFEAEVTDEDRYLAYLEERLTAALSRVEGVGKVQVMITLKSSRELVVERETPVSRSATNETDSQGGSRVISQVETGDSVVYQSQGADSEPYVIKTLTPEVEGVLVVAEGAGSGTVNRTVTAIVQALLDVEAHKVSVVRMARKDE